MTSDWQIQSIGDICSKITSGGTPSRKNNGFYKNGIHPWIKTKELQGGWIYDAEEYITDEALEKSSAKLLPQNTILLAMYGATVGELGILAREMACNQACCAMTVNSDKADYRYLFYLLLHQKAQIKVLASGSAQQNLSVTQIENFRFPYPPLREQKAIADVLSSLDDKIEHNRRMIETLEAMGKALFQSWFVNFDPVRAKAAGHPTELPDAISTLFPDELVSSQLGDIPKRWEVAVISNFGQVICGKTPPTKKVENFGGDYPFITIPDMRQGLVSVNAERTISEVGAKVLEGKLLPSGSICVSCIATPGLVTLTSRKSFTNQQINSIVPAKSIYREFILFAMIQMGDLIGAVGSGGSVFANMNTRKFKELPLLRPIDEVLSAFSDICNPTMKKILSLQKEIDVIMKLRDTLLPKLISGELRMKDVQ